MVSTTRRSREDWIAAGLTELAAVGVDALRVDTIAATLAVTKGSFYWHFTDREDLLSALADGWETSTEQVISRVERSESDPAGRARRLWRITVGDPSLQVEFAIRDWARRSEAIATRVRRVDERRLQYVAALLVQLGVPKREVQARSLLIYSLLIGDFLITTEQTPEQRRKLADQALRLVLPG